MPTEVRQEKMFIEIIQKYTDEYVLVNIDHISWINLDESIIHMDDGTKIESAESITTDDLKNWWFNILC